MKLKILSWNIWQGVYLEGVKNFLKEIDADIVALQEVSDDERNITKDIANALGYSYATAFDMSLPMKYVPESLRTNVASIKYGNVILTKQQILSSSSPFISAEDGRTIVTADIKIDEKVIHVFGLHLKHTHQEASQLQNMQADNLIKLIPETNSVVLGDFNSLSDSYPIKKISEILLNTETETPVPTWSVYRDGCSICQLSEVKHKLDYIFVTKDIKVETFKLGQSKGSDHLPIVATIEI